MLLAIAVAAALAALMTRALHPIMVRYALARPNARSSHRIPTPQGAGIAVIAATLIVAGLFSSLTGLTETRIPALVIGATIFIALVGAADDIRSIPVTPRLLLQGVAVAAILFASGTIRIFPELPVWLERALLLLAGLWFVNLVNFMDGLDWMTVAEVVPVTAALVLLGSIGALSPPAALVAATLGGAIAGFAPFNRPVAKIFLGDVGSLPIGLLLGWCLLQLASEQNLTAALLLPLYYLADATVTLLRRIAGRERIMDAHRSHFYQRATDNGFTVLGVVREVFVLNLGLAALAILSVFTTSVAARLALLLIGTGAVVIVLRRFSRRHAGSTLNRP
ncbi:MAG TPA: glycosyltransferase family 4 protein [Bradyrhizobium sp.]|nr:glycosyltransferase family 4 protein [Bradyrhizobium sp.]